MEFIHCFRQAVVRGLFATLALVACVAVAAPDRPDAVVVSEPTPQLLCSLYPALSRLNQPPVLVHSAGNEQYLTEYISQIGARSVWLLDPARKAPADWRQQFQLWESRPAALALDIARRCWPDATSVVLVGDREADLIVPACLLATARGVPAFCCDGKPEEALRDWLRSAARPEILCVGKIALRQKDFPNAKITSLASTSEVLAEYQKSLGEPTPEHLVVLGPATQRPDRQVADFDLLVPSYAVAHRAAVAVLDRREDVEGQIHRLLAERYPEVKYVTLWGPTSTLPDEEVDDPVAAAGLETKLTEPKVAVAPLSGLTKNLPCQFRVGRITGDSLSAVSLLVARNLHRPEMRPGKPPTALILANIDYELPLMETITRTTAQTFDKCGWQTRAAYGWKAGWYKKPNRLWGADLVVYEGHTANLQLSVQFDAEREPVFPGLYVFQGCKTLRQPEVMALLRNGATGVVGTTTNTYSASGSALAKTYVDAMLLDQMDAGTSLMVARNFMLALADLKERRGHEQSPKILRGGMTFSLWGDPTWRPPPSPSMPDDADRVRTVRKGNQIDVLVPETFASPVTVDEYTAQIPIGAKLAGMYEWENEERTRRQLPPLYFVVVPLGEFADGSAPKISSPLAKNRWTSLWDDRNRWLYLLIQSSARNDHDQGKKLSFRID